MPTILTPPGARILRPSDPGWNQFTASARLLHLPAAPEAPDPVRGPWFAVTEKILRPLRPLAAARDIVGTVPVQALGRLHMDPDRPEPITGDGLMLASLPPEAVGVLLRAAGPDTLLLLTAVELCHAGGGCAAPGLNHPTPPAAPGEQATAPGYSASTPGNRADRPGSSGNV